MKRIFVLLLALLMLFCSVGCQKTGEGGIPGNSQEETIDGYIKAEYEKYNSPASENGLGGTLLYDDVSILEVELIDEYIYILVENKDSNQYIIGVGNYPVWSPVGLYDYVGKNVRIFFEYLGFSGVNQLPFGHIINVGKLELDTGEIVTSDNFLASSLEFRDWVAKNGAHISSSQIENTDAMYVMLSGMATDVLQLKSSKVASIYLCEKGDNGYEGTYMSLKYEKMPSASEIKDGDGLMVYGYISEGVFKPVYVEPTQVDFTLGDIEKDYKNRCEVFSYTAIARDPELYKGKLAKFSGKVIQVLEDGNKVTLRVNVTKNAYSYEDTIYVTYIRKDSSESRILENDMITLYGTLMGLETYTTVLGGSVTIPKIAAEYIEIN